MCLALFQLYRLQCKNFVLFSSSNIICLYQFPHTNWIINLSKVCVWVSRKNVSILTIMKYVFCHKNLTFLRPKILKNVLHLLFTVQTHCNLIIHVVIFMLILFFMFLCSYSCSDYSCNIISYSFFNTFIIVARRENITSKWY